MRNAGIATSMCKFGGFHALAKPCVVKKFDNEEVSDYLTLGDGSIYRNTFVATIYIQSMVKEASHTGLSHVFAYFYNQPRFPAKQAILSIPSGILFDLAQSSLLITNAALDESITFPVVTTCPTLFILLVCIAIFKKVQ
uniref:Uncharacterized protein n=1 Tax=Echinococcus canadensis TaxID=519352 RepID=A0A915EXU1_9CEST